MKYLSGLTLALIFSSIVNVYGQEEDEKKSLLISSSFTIDNVFNLTGGIEKGSSTLGLFDFSILYTPFKSSIFQKTRFHIHLLKTGGKGPSENFIGDAQVASNIEGKSSRFLYEALVIQQFGNICLSFGLHDLNTEFMMSEYAGDFINSSFGIFPAVSLNVPVSIFPVTSVGGILCYHKNSFGFAAGLYNLNNDYLEEEEFNFQNHLYQKGYLAVAEISYHLESDNNLTGEYKLGGYFKDCSPGEEFTEDECTLKNENYGIYGIADQSIVSIGSNFQLGIFAQIGLSPKKTNYVPDYYGAGISIHTNDKKYAPEFVGLAFGTVGLNSYSAEMGYYNPVRETAIELSAKKTLFEKLTLQPDLQYIISPSGIYENALVGILRLQVELNNE